MSQPPLDHHYVVMHLGGAKRVARSQDGPKILTLVDCDSLTFVPAGTAYLWRTEGPIAFAHLYVPPRQLESVIAHDFDAEGRDATLLERVGCRDRFLEPLLHRMIQEIQCAPHPSQLLRYCLLEIFCLRLAHRHGPQKARRASHPVALAPHRLERVLDFMDANLGGDIGLNDLVTAAGSSQSHFSRAFHKATGSSPYGYFLKQRIGYARVLLLTGDLSLESIASTCGFRRKDQFAFMFKRSVGVGPKRFRIANAHRDGRGRSDH